MNISKPLPQDQNGEIIGYSIQLTQASNGLLTTFTSGVDQLFTASSLPVFTTFSYNVAATTANGTGPFSRSFTVTTNETGNTIKL